jgi:ketosteroid isomerase-like protein
MRISLSILIFLVGFATGLGAQTTQHERDLETLRAAIIRSGEAFNARDHAAMMAPVARDLVLTYPGIPDMGYDSLSAGYRRMVDRPAGVTARTVPTVEEVLVSGDLAVIRITWTTTVTETSPARSTTRQMRDMQVWRREADGGWKFFRGMHFRNPPVTPPTPQSTTASGG